MRFVERYIEKLKLVVVKANGGGSSLRGTIEGGLMAGGTGPVIRSRNKIEGQPIMSKTVTKDEIRGYVRNEKNGVFISYIGMIGCLVGD